MKTLIKKEIRLLLPAWITAMLLAIVPGILNIAWVSDTSDGSIFIFAQLIFAAGVLFLGINSFGEELSYNTFSAMLAQPMKRPRIWLIKVATLATAFVSVWLTGLLIALLQIGVLNQWFRGHQDISNAFEFITLSALVTFSGGLWTTLLLRQTTGAFWFTLLTPLAIILGISSLFRDSIELGKSINTYIVDALVLYSIAGFFLAWRLFMRAQDVQWIDSEISLPHRGRPSKIRAGSLSFRPRHWLSALAWKELQLHQGTFLIAAIILALHLTACFIRTFHPFTQNPDIEFALQTIWILWLIMPLLIGAAAIAEERRMATLEPLLCLPVSRAKQLLVKFCIALILSFVFGILMPLIIERTNIFGFWPRISVVAAEIFLLSFCASSLGRTTLQAIGWAILLALLIYNGVLFPTSRPLMTYNGRPEFTPELLKQCLDAIILPIVLGWLTFSNFRHAHQNWRFWLRNLIAVLVVFVCVPFLARFCLWIVSVRRPPY